MNRNNKKSIIRSNDFDISFARGLNLEDGVATLQIFQQHYWRTIRLFDKD